MTTDQNAGLREALEKIAAQVPYRSGFSNADISYEPALTAMEAQQVASAALSALPETGSGAVAWRNGEISARDLAHAWNVVVVLANTEPDEWRSKSAVAGELSFAKGKPSLDPEDFSPPVEGGDPASIRREERERCATWLDRRAEYHDAQSSEAESRDFPAAVVTWEEGLARELRKQADVIRSLPNQPAPKKGEEQ